MGNAIVATNVDGIPEALDFGGRGLLVPPADPVALAEAIARLINDTDLRRRMSAASLLDLDEVTVRRMSERTLRVYDEAIKREATPKCQLELAIFPQDESPPIGDDCSSRAGRQSTNLIGTTIGGGRSCVRSDTANGRGLIGLPFPLAVVTGAVSALVLPYPSPRRQHR